MDMDYLIISSLIVMAICLSVVGMILVGMTFRQNRLEDGIDMLIAWMNAKADYPNAKITLGPDGRLIIRRGDL